MKKIQYVSVALTLLLNGCYLLAPVDKSKYSDIEGHVFSLDNNGPLNEAEIKVLENQNIQKTDRNGNFLLKSTPVDWVNIEIKAPGYETLVRKVKVEPYGSKYVDFWISKEPQKLKTEKILFERNGDIWLTDEYGINQTNLTDKVKEQAFNPEIMSTATFSSPKWFDNKSKIAYILTDISPRPFTKNGLWVMNTKGKMTQRITYIDSLATDLNVSLDGKNFLFSMFNPDNASNVGVFKYSTMTNKLDSLSSNLAIRDYNPKLSPTSDLIIYNTASLDIPAVTSNDRSPYRVSRLQIYSMNSKGFTRKQLTNNGENIDPSWSPDGQKIIFVSNRTGFQEIWSMNKDGSAQRKLTNLKANKLRNPVWSADGERILFNCDLKQKHYTINPTDLWIFEPATHNYRMISNDATKPDW